MPEERGKLLIVDDDPNNLRVYERVLAPLNLDISKALSGQKALEQAYNKDFFLILMDVQMPNMDGYETASLILGNQKTSHIPIIFITAIAKDDAFEFKGYVSGAVDYMVKPVNDDILRCKVSVFLKLKIQEKELEMERDHARYATAKAEKATRIKSEFLAQMSHEIRTPMNGCIGAMDLLLESEVTEDQRKLLEIAHRSGYSLMTIINDILDVSKMEEGMVSLERISVNFKDILIDVVSLMEIRAKEKNIDLRTSYPKNLPNFMGDPTRIRQIILNLVGNAIKFTEQGFIEIKIATTPIDPFEKNVFLHVIDTGIGIPENRLEAIFKSFAQADDDTSRKYGGTGLGMTISRKLAGLMRGELLVKSEVGKGSTFSLRIPMRISDEKSIDKATALEALKRAYGKRALLAEDNKSNAFIAVKVLNKLGIEVDAVENGQLAVDRCNDGYDVILMDVQMPIVDGIEATRRLKAAGCSTPVLAMTADVMPEQMHQCREVGMSGFIGKPLIRKNLVKELDKFLL